MRLHSAAQGAPHRWHHAWSSLSRTSKGCVANFHLSRLRVGAPAATQGAGQGSATRVRSGTGRPWPPGAPAPGRTLVCGVALQLSAWQRPAGGAWGAARPRASAALGGARPSLAGRSIASPPASRVGQLADGGDVYERARGVAVSLARRG